MITRPCIDCGVLAARTRCVDCQSRWNKKRNSRRTHYTGDYRRRAKEIRDNAVVCWICGEGARQDDPWTADHLAPAHIDSVLLPAHRSCNSRRGDARRTAN